MAEQQPGEGRAWGALALIFVGSRVALHMTGVHIEVGRPALHVLDPEVLAHSPARALWNLHMQPPGLTALTALVVQLPEGAQVPAAEWLFSALGALATGCLYWLVRELGAPPRWALTAAVVYCLGSEALLYERLFYYPLPLAAALLLGMCAALRFFERGSTGSALLAVASFTAMTLTYALFHPLWLLLVFALLSVGARAGKHAARALLTACALSALLVAGVVLKNGVRFGSYGLTSWTGMNLATTTHWLDPEGLQAMVDRGELSPVSRVLPFEGLTAVERAAGAPRHPPELWALRTSSGHWNYNHAAVVGLARRYAADWRRAMGHAPERYLRSLAHSLHATFLRPSADFRPLSAQRARVAAYADVQDHLFGRVASGVPAREGELRGRSRMWHRITHGAPLLALALVVTLGVALRRAWQSDGVRVHWWRLAALMLVWSMLLPALVNRGEGNRIRVVVGPLLVAVFVTALREWSARRAARH
ncbi:MAG: hypothetical protein OXT09_15845 [Myxococcales bacterium]|nr:hypothetical protein [Myxococcales bacterium]